MSPKLNLIDQQQVVDELIKYLADKDLVSYDVETTGVHKGAEVVGLSVSADETEAFYIILARWHTGSQQLVYTGLDVKPLLTLLASKSLIMHNSVFDCARTNENFKIELIQSVHTDTMLLAHTLNENRRIGLKELGKEYFGADATKEAEEMKASVIANGGIYMAKNKEMYKADADILGKYGAMDALLTYRLFFEMLPELEEQGLWNFFYNDEVMPLLREVTYELNTTGLKVDTEKLLQLQKTLEAENEEAKAFINKEIQPFIKTKYPGTSKKNTFNLGATQQLSWLIFGELRLEFSTLTKAGKEACKALGLKIPYTKYAKQVFLDTCAHHKGAVLNGKKIRDPWAYTQCDKTTLQKLKSRYKWIEKLLLVQKNSKILSTYVEGIKKGTQYGAIYPSFLQTGTTSGRYSSRNPNFQNLPRDDKRVKGTVIARSGKSFVGADYSQLEPRVFAYFSGDEKLQAAFSGQSDFYSTIGIEVFDKYDSTPHKEGQNAFGEKYKDLRQIAKVIALATTYGSTAFKLSGLIGKPVDETQEIIDAYFERFPGVRKYMLEYHEKAKKDGEVSTLFGKKRRMPEAKLLTKIYGNQDHADLPYEARNILNLAVNHPIQGTGANIVNRACIAFKRSCKAVGIEAKIVLQVHDSIIAECHISDSEDVALLLQSAMEDTTELKGIKLEAVPKIGVNLGEV